MNLPFIDRIWCVRGSLDLDPPQSSHQAFVKLDSLFHETGTTYSIRDGTLTFRKEAPAAQDKMATFNHGILHVEKGGSRLAYELSSKTLLFCFVLPFFFLAIAWLIKEARNPGYVFAGIFAVLYIVGRVLEPWLIRSVFRKNLSEEYLPDCQRPLA